MSATLAYAPRPSGAALRRPADALEIVPQPRRVQIVTTRAQRRARPKLVYALGATGVIFAIFLAQLLITIALSGGAYTITDLQSTEQNLGRTASSLGEKLDTLGSSQNLQANALALGMVSSSQAAFLRLSDGSVLGSASPAGAAGTPSGADNAAGDTVPNSLLTTIPLIKSTGVGHGDANAPVSSSNNSQSTQGSSTASTGNTAPASTNSSNSGDLPSPVTH
ncbi:MAG: hypothetical protein QOD50_590 [Actinomycetota bacterium]|jgi:hypothetical protein|nr:hypothetical protein [Actinomycetota bacterium]